MTPDREQPRPKLPSWPDREIGALAGRQQTNVTRAQLLAIGVASRTISWALQRGRLHRVHNGVYSLVTPASRPALADERAALLACGDRAVLSHTTAARLHGLRLPVRPGAIQVTVAGHRRGRLALVVHRTSSLPRGERRRVAGLPVTSIERTLVDLASDLGARTLEHAVDQALRKTSHARLRTTAMAHRNRRGVTALLRLLDPARPSTDTWSHAEESLHVLLRQAGLPAPETNVAIGRHVPDLLWRDQRVIVEYDSDEFHSGSIARGRDTVRHNRFSAQGFTVLHLCKADIAERSLQTLVLIATALAQGSARGPERAAAHPAPRV